MNNYIKYTYYDEQERLIAIVSRNIPKETMQEYKEVKFKE